MCSVNEIEQLESAMLHMGVPDTKTVKQAEEQIKAALTNWRCVLALTHLIRNSSHLQVRQLSAVLLRVKISKFWKSVPPNDQAGIKNVLLESLANEKQRIVALNITYLIAALSKSEFSAADSTKQPQGWPELLSFLQTFASDRTPGRQELSMLMFYALTETIGTFFHEHFDSLLQLYKSVLENPVDEKSRVAALKASSSLIEFVGDGEEVLAFRELVPYMLQGLKVNVEDENVAVPIMEVITLLAESPVPVLNPHIRDCVQVLLTIASSPGITIGTRRAASGAIKQVISLKTRLCARGKLFQPIVTAAINIIQQDYVPFRQKVLDQDNSSSEEEDDDDEEDMESQLRGMSLEILGAITTSFPRKQTFKPLMEAAVSRMQTAGTENAPTRWVGLVLLLQCTEGFCFDNGDSNNSLGDKQTLAPLLDLVLGMAKQESEPNLRATALMCISELVEYCPEIWDHSYRILPIVLVLLDDHSAAVRASACDVVDFICDRSDVGHLLPHLQRLVEKLLMIIQDGRGRLSLKSTALEALSTVMVTARDHYKPFFEHTAPILAKLMSLTDENVLQLRAYATCAMGRLAVSASGKANLSREERTTNIMAWEPMLFEALTYAVHGLQFNDLTLTQMTYEMFGDFSIALGPRIDTQAEALIHALINGCVGEDGIEYSVEDREGAMVPQNISDAFGSKRDEDQAEIDLENESDGNDDFGTGYTPGVKVAFNVRTSMVDAKVKALYGLEQLVENASFPIIAPFIEDILKSTNHLIEYIHPEVRAQAISLMKAVTLAVFAHYPLPPLPHNLKEVNLAHHLECHREIDEDKCWLPGLPTQFSLAQPVRKIVDSVFWPAALCILEEEDDDMVVCTCCNAMESLTAHLGPSFVEGKINEIMNLICVGLDRGLVCQHNDYFEEDEDEDEDLDRDTTVFDEVCSMLGMIAQACGNGFQEYMPQVTKLLFKVLNGKQTTQLERVTALGAFSEILTSFGANNNSDYMKAILQFGVQLLSQNIAPTSIFNQSSARTLSRNAVFLIGTVVELSDERSLSVDVVMGVLNEVGKAFQLVEPCESAAREFVETHGNQVNLPLDITDIQAVVDNACGALARILLVNHNKLPVDKILPSLLSALPLRNDFSEGFAVFHCLYVLVQKQDPAIMRSIPQLLNIFEASLNNDNTKGESRRYIMETLKLLNIPINN